LCCFAEPPQLPSNDCPGAGRRRRQNTPRSWILALPWTWNPTASRQRIQGKRSSLVAPLQRRIDPSERCTSSFECLATRQNPWGLLYSACWSNDCDAFQQSPKEFLETFPADSKQP